LSDTVPSPAARRRAIGAHLARFLSVLATAWLIMLGSAVLVASGTSDAAAFITAALILSAVSAAGVSWLLWRRARHRPRGVFLAIEAIIAVAVAAASFLVPLPDNAPPTSESAEPAYRDLPSGSRLAYLHLVAVGTPAPVPVVILHGGPGIPDMAGEIAAYGGLTELGFDVFLYDQVGAGRSSRLSDPREYGLDRDVADLEQVREAIGADRMILIGHSYGATLAAHYLAAHSERVDRLVLTSPGPLDPTDRSTSAATSRLAFPARLATFAAALQPRALLGYVLLQVDPRAAHSFLSDSEADARNDTILSLADGGLHCQAGKGLPVSGSGFYALQYPQSAAADSPVDVREQLSGNKTPVLLFKGGCDYLSWQSAIDYRQTLPKTTVIYLPEAGHNIYQDEPGTILQATGAFLTGVALPIPRYTSTAPPPDYQHE
jgi:proline iminopeptidase